MTRKSCDSTTSFPLVTRTARRDMRLWEKDMAFFTRSVNYSTTEFSFCIFTLEGHIRDAPS